MSAPVPPTDRVEPLDVIPVMTWWVRVGLLTVATALAAVFVVAVLLNPYRDDGTARTMETHRQLGLPECTFKKMTQWPCPSCGMTTSFALLMRGDVWSSLQANAVGTLLAAACLALIPWSIASALAGRPMFTLTVERPLVIGVIALVVLMMVRWVIVLLALWWGAA